MIPFLIISLGIILLALLLSHEKKEDRKSAFITKTILSLLFVATALLQPHLIPNYSSYLITGLILCLVGDVCLALPERFFKAGLAAFLLGHGFYIVSFATLTDISQWVSLGALLFSLISAMVFLWLRPHLGVMRGPVLVYILVITVMVSAAWAADWKTGLPAGGRTLILLGAISFYVSDIFVARNKFIKNEFLNRLIGLPLYYLGQFLLAFSPRFLG
jgi:uncharacterized membrane protein YhhN